MNFLFEIDDPDTIDPYVCMFADSDDVLRAWDVEPYELHVVLRQDMSSWEEVLEDNDEYLESNEWIMIPAWAALTPCGVRHVG